MTDLSNITSPNTPERILLTGKRIALEIAIETTLNALYEMAFIDGTKAAYNLEYGIAVPEEMPANVRTLIKRLIEKLALMSAQLAAENFVRAEKV